MNNEKLIELFVAAMQAKDKSPNTIKNYVADVKQFLEFEGATRGDGGVVPGRKAVREFIQQNEKSGLSKTTINRRLQSLRLFFDVLVEHGIIDENPTEGIKAKKVARQNETKWLERHQVRAIFEAIDRIKQGEDKRFRDRAIISVLVNCGLRVQELCDLRMSDIDWDNGLLEIVGKGGKFRKVPFPSATQDAVKRWLKFRRVDTPYLFHTERSDRITPRAVQHLTKKLSEDLNFSFTVHQLRHTALKNIADKTGKIEIVASIAGHEDVNTSRRYIEPSLKEIGEAMKDCEYDF